MSEKDELAISVVLLGKIGNGKSATGNTMLGKSQFQESNYPMPPSEGIKDYSTEYNGQKFRVYDTMGLMDADNDMSQALKKWHEDMNRLMQICKYRKEDINVFLLVRSGTGGFSRDDKETMDIIKETFGGDEFLQKFCIIVITRQDCVNENERDYNQRQVCGLKRLAEDCQNRVVKVCNKEIENERKDSRDRLMSAILELKDNNKKPYTYEDFLKYELERKRLILGYDLDKIVEDCRNRINLIKFKSKAVHTRSDRETLLKKIAILREQILEKDAGTKKLQHLTFKLDSIEKDLPESFCCVQ